MFLGQEPSMLYLMPFSSTLYMSVWEVLSTTKIIFLPFLIALIYSWATARAQGLDEGSPAVLSLKLVEKTAWWYLFVIFLFLVPTKPTPVSVNSYICGAEARSPVFPGDSPSNRSIAGSVEFPLMLGLINNLSVATFESLKGKLYCGVDTKLESEVAATAYVIKDPVVRRQAKIFGDECYTNAVKRYQESSRVGSLRPIFDDPPERDNYFFGINSMLLYEGAERTDFTQAKLVSTFNADYWTGSMTPSISGPLLQLTDSWLSYEKVTVLCSGFATHLYHILGNAIDTDYADVLRTRLETKKQYPDAEGVVWDRYRVRDEMINKMFIDSMLGYDDKLLVDKDQTNRANYMASATGDFAVAVPSLNGNAVKFDEKTVQLITSQAHTTFSGTPTKSISKVGSWLGSFVNWFTGMFKSQAVFVYGATVFANVLTLAFVIFPIYLLLAGYTVKAVFNVALVVVYVTGLFFMLELSFVVSNTLSAASDSMGGIEVGSFYSMTLLGLSTTTVIVSVVIWTSIMGALGMTLGPLVDNILSNQVMGAGLLGMKVLKDVAMTVITKGKSLGKK